MRKQLLTYLEGKMLHAQEVGFTRNSSITITTVTIDNKCRVRSQLLFLFFFLFEYILNYSLDRPSSNVPHVFQVF